MDKILTIIRREYMVRIRSKTFILTTLLMPLGLGLIMLIPILSSVNVEEEHYTVFVQDRTGGKIAEYLTDDRWFNFESSPDSKGRSDLNINELLLEISPAFELDGDEPVATVWQDKQISLQVKTGLKRRLHDATQKYRLKKLNLEESDFKKLRFSVELTERSLSGEGEETTSSTEVASVAGYAMGFIIYIMLIMYGMFVMRGVIEEKSNRIMELMISTVKPFQLMMGKIIGIGAVGLTQALVWVFMFMGIVFSIGLFFQPDPAALQGISEAQMKQMNPEETAVVVEQMLQALNWSSILMFLFYFLGGFMLFGSLFAAVGSTVDQETDAQQLTFPVMLPLIIPMLVLGNIIQNPNGSLAKFMSIFPFFSPTTMMVRYAATDVPWWEIALSMLLLVLGFIGTVWLAAKIYRTGVLMYGKKVSLREIWKWLRHY